MNELADRHATQDIGSIFLYTNEAHPGENYPHLTSFAQKLTHARALRDVLHVNRPILVDSLDGACHRAFGSMPNMTWIFNKAYVPVYKSDWTNIESVANTIEYLLGVLARRREGTRVAPFHVERLDYRIQDRERFYAGLERNGPKAVDEFSRAFPS